MSHAMHRRQALRVFGTALVAGGVTVAGVATASASTLTQPRNPSRSARRRGGDPVIPVVPGMSGDPRANEMWYQFDLQLGDGATPAVMAANNALSTVLPGDPEVSIIRDYMAQRTAGTYPASFKTLVSPLKDALTVISAAELSVFHTYYGDDYHGLMGAFEDFGQGVLYDPRRVVGQKTHIMDGHPPVSYHSWHCFIRGMQMLGIHADEWARIDPMLGLAWEIQSIVKPPTDTLMPGLPESVLKPLRRKWLHMSPADIDQQYMTYPYPVGVS
ncbi:hypothetical protein [Streptacidiphilus sp. EB129]|jgi:hypothetical protein|uniref:hypothetical protein n=1 Tax=Streptacidiphilus sp. EB129 TaxID=3156262 RepID=UPI003512B325